MKKKATLLGATGLIGGQLLTILQSDEAFEEVKVIVRSPLEIKHPKVKVVVIDFNVPAQFETAMEGSEVVFCAIGTTQKKVKGDKEAYKRIDFDIPVNAAKYSLQAGAQQFLIVSSIGADSKKKGFYLKLKGEVEDALTSLNFTSLFIFRPSLLLGKRSESRTVEDIGQFFSKILKLITPSKFKPIEGEKVAKAMVEASKSNKKGVEIYHYKEMQELIKR